MGGFQLYSIGKWTIKLSCISNTTSSCGGSEVEMYIEHLEGSPANPMTILSIVKLEKRTFTHPKKLTYEILVCSYEVWTQHRSSRTRIHHGFLRGMGTTRVGHGFPVFGCWVNAKTGQTWSWHDLNMHNRYGWLTRRGSWYFRIYDPMNHNKISSSPRVLSLIDSYHSIRSILT